jgi:hypothetical protein
MEKGTDEGGGTKRGIRAFCDEFATAQDDWITLSILLRRRAAGKPTS